MQDLHQLPRLRDSLSYLYVEHAVVERQDGAVLFLQETGRTAVPAASLSLLLLGPGTNITHAAICLLADSGCSILWIGEDMQKFYAQGLGETRRAYHLLRQAEMVSDLDKRLKVVMKMYAMRFGYELLPDLSIEQIRGMEGARVRTAYATMSRQYGIEWQGRKYDRKSWANADPVNRALSAANAVLNGICHAAIVSGGYSPALGFLHTGLQLSFVYDIADLYKTEITVPIAFQTAAEDSHNVEARARESCREYFRENKLLEKILPDIDKLLEVPDGEDWAMDSDPGSPELWWQPVDLLQGDDPWSS
ncbi:MAG: type I-E CRISPR-associated endonuclease Cas1e [Bellilinea sp.]